MPPKLRDLIQELREVKTWEKPKVELEQYPTPPDIAAHMLFAADDEGDVEDALVADLGCGGCILGIAAALMGAAHVTGFDIDPAALKVAAENVEEAEVSVDLVACDVTQLAMRGEACDSNEMRGGGETQAASSSSDATAFPSFIDSSYTTKVEYTRAKAAAMETARASAVDTAHENSTPTASAVSEGGDGSSALLSSQLPIGCGAFDLVLMNPPFGTQKGSNGVDMRFLRAGLALCTANGAVYSLNKTSTRSFIAKTAASWGAPHRTPYRLGDGARRP